MSTILERRRQRLGRAKVEAEMSDGLNTAFESLSRTAHRIANERNALLGALRELLDATGPVCSCEDRALNEAQVKAERLLAHIREGNEKEN